VRPLASALVLAALLVWGVRASAIFAPPPRAVLSLRGLAAVPGDAVPGGLVGSVNSYALTVDGAKVLAALRPHGMYAIASTTKIMTAYLALTRLSPTTTLVVSPTILAGTAAQAAQGGVVMPLTDGERLTLPQVMDALLLPSANNAALLLAQQLDGSEAAFVRDMNRTAAAMGLRDTHFADPSGLNPATQSSALDLSRLAARALTVPAFAAYVTRQSAQVPGWSTVHNLNQLLTTYPGAIGVKTGNTDQAGFCLVFAARRDIDGSTVTLVGAVLGAQSMDRAFADATRLLNAGFATSRTREVLAAGRVVATLRRPGGPPLARLAVAQPLRLPGYDAAQGERLALREVRATAGDPRWQLVVQGAGGAVLARLPLRATPVA